MSAAPNIERKEHYAQLHVKQPDAEQVEGRVIRFVASTPEEDRDGDTIDQAGISLEHFMRNPVFQWAHDYDIPPIGKVIAAKVENGNLVADVKFLDPADFADGDPHAMFADHIFRLYRQGVLNAVSIGFIPHKAKPREEGGFHFSEVEMLELSGVPVQSNRGALQVRELQKSVEAVKDWARKALDRPVEKVGQTLNAQNRSRAREAFKSIVALMRSGGMDPLKELDGMEEGKAHKALVAKPYDGPDDPALMEEIPGIEDLSTEERTLWVRVFNESFEACSATDTDEQTCEERAIAAAWSAVNQAEGDAMADEQMEQNEMDEEAKQMNEDTQREVVGMLESVRSGIDAILDLMGMTDEPEVEEDQMDEEEEPDMKDSAPAADKGVSDKDAGREIKVRFRQ